VTNPDGARKALQRNPSKLSTPQHPAPLMAARDSPALPAKVRPKFRIIKE
jgi:hypothetical protein